MNHTSPRILKLIRIGLTATTLTVFPMLYQGYYYPKLFVVVLASLIYSILLFFRNPLILPRLNSALSALLLLIAVSVFQSFNHLEFFQSALWISGIVIFLFTLQLSDSDQRKAKLFFWQLGLLQIFFVFTQWLAPEIWQSLNIGFVDQRSSGLIGNREFLSTFLGLGVLLRVPSLAKQWKDPAFPSVLISLASLGFINSKGTLLVIGIAWALNTDGRVSKKVWALAALVLCVIAVKSQSVRSRILLWLVGLKMGWDYFPTGTGEGGFQQAYFGTLETLFMVYPRLRFEFGDLAGVVSDAHNFIIHAFAEAGILGLFSALAITQGLVHWIRRTSQHQERAIAVFILIKLMYTVVSSSPVSVIVSAIALGLVYPKRYCTIVAATQSTTTPKYLTRYQQYRLKQYSIKSIQLVLCVLGLIHLGIVARGGFVEYLYSRGLKYLKSENLSQAQPFFTRASRILPQRSDVWLALAYIAIRERPVRNPEPYLIQGLKTGTDFNTLKIAAQTYLLSGDCYHATELFNRIHTAFPDHLSSLSGLAICAKNRGDIKSARQFAQILLTTQPRVPTKTYGLNLLTAGSILEKSWKSMEEPSKEN